MRYATLTIGIDEFNYGDAHFRRSDNARAIFNPFIGNYIMEASPTEAFGELNLQKDGWIAVVGLTNGKLNQSVVVNNNSDNKPSIYGKIGFDKQISDDLHLRLTASVFSQNTSLGTLLAIIIGVQNLPEAFNAFMDLKTTFSARKSLIILFLLSFSGIVAALFGYYLLSDLPMTIGGLMLFSAGGIVYLIFQDIAPMAKLKRTSIPALGASLGFLLGMIGVKLLG